jgi:hypothetical protein
MSRLLRALALGALVAAISGTAAGTAAAVTFTPGGAFTLASTRLQTFNIPSIGATYTCLWNLNARLLTTEIPLDAQLHKIGGAIGGIINCNERGVSISMLISGLNTAPGPWPFGFVPTTGTLHLIDPDGVLLTMLAVRIRVTTMTGFSCLFTGTIGLLFKDNTETVILLGGEFTATPTIGDTCAAGLAATKGAGVLATGVEWRIA